MPGWQCHIASKLAITNAVMYLCFIVFYDLHGRNLKCFLNYIFQTHDVNSAHALMKKYQVIFNKFRMPYFVSNYSEISFGELLTNALTFDTSI